MKFDGDIGKAAEVLAAPAPAAPQTTVGQQSRGIDPIAWLRDHSSYLAPRRGWSADTWSVVSLYFRHLLINWVILVPLILALLLVPLLHLHMIDNAPRTAVLAVEGFLYALLAVVRWYKDGTRRIALDVTIATIAFGCAAVLYGRAELQWPAPAAATALIPLALSIEWLLGSFVAAASRAAPFAILRERLTRDGGRAIAIGIAWLAIHALVFYLPSRMLTAGAQGVIALIAIGGIAGILTALGGFWARIKTAGQPRIRDRFGNLLLNVAAGAFIVFFLGGMGALVNMTLVAKFATQPPGNAPDVRQPAAIENYIETRAALEERLARFETVKKWTPPGGYEVGKEPHGYLEREAQGQLRTAARGVLNGVETAMGRRLLKLELLLLTEAARYTAALENLGRAVIALFFLFAGIAVCGMAYLGVNTFSMSSFYGNRLVRAYLGASRDIPPAPPGPQPPAPPTVDPYTGFDPTDDLPMSRLLEGRTAPVRLFHVVCAALNLSRGSKLRWQQRKASSFIVTPLHAGSWSLGFQRSESYAGPEGISLGRAIAMSGAAVSPNMGYHTSPLVAFVMTFFNARLGVWVPNPGPPGSTVWKQAEPGAATFPIVRELLADTDDLKPFVYVSDGGHFDNLGIYEMVRRRCERIIAIDATADPDYTYHDLAEAIGKIRTDTGTQVIFDQCPDANVAPSLLYHTARIHYPERDDQPAFVGELIYVKPALAVDLPVDVLRYARAHDSDGDRFPHQSTANQFFNEEQFESYRILGAHLMMRVLEHEDVTQPARRGESPRPVVPPPLVAPKHTVTAPPAQEGGAAQRPGVPVPMPGTLASALQSWSAASVLGVGLTVGGAVGVAGTVAVAPDQKVAVDPNARVQLDPNARIKLDPDTQLAFPSDIKVQLDPEARVQLAPDARVPLDPNSRAAVDPNAVVRIDPNARVQLDPNARATVDPNSFVRLDPNTRVQLDPAARAGVDPNARVRLDPAARVSLDPNSRVPVSADSTVRLAPNTTVTISGPLPPVKVEDAQITALAKELAQVKDALNNIGPRRGAIDGREGTR